MKHTQTPLNDQLGPLVTRFGHHRVVRMTEWGGVGWGGYLRLDQFLDHLTVIKIGHLVYSMYLMK